MRGQCHTVRELMQQDPQPPDSDELPTHDELAKQLRRLMTKGLPAARADDVTMLLSLHAIRVLELVDLPSARLAALRERIHELMRGTRSEVLRRLAPYAFGTYSVESVPLGTRLEHAAQSGIGYGTEALRKKYLGELASDFADRLLWLEERLRYNKWLDRPFDEVLHDETLRKYDFYSAMAFWLNGAALDLEAALEDYWEDNEDGLRSFAYSALWRWTKFLRYAHRYDVEFLGRWSFRYDSTGDIDEAVRAQYDAQALPPLTPLDRSWLRVELLTALHEELDPFISALERQPHGRDILARWMQWLRSCQCEPNKHLPDCSVDRFMHETTTFFEMINHEVSESHYTDRAARFKTLPDIFGP